MTVLVSMVVSFLCAWYPDFSLSPTIPPRPTGTGEEGPRSQTKTMLNPLWPELEFVMAGNSVEVPLPPDYEVQLIWLLGVVLHIYFNHTHAFVAVI
ncbi:unnamed protein product [Brassica rapa]|uniref:Uncharacterized protein n=1 Tax=Brassica campestris TaxID=3711 RepID=A0A8D9MAJ8_BRACM|nr:unnamed protein product [Brassica rapa]